MEVATGNDFAAKDHKVVSSRNTVAVAQSFTHGVPFGAIPRGGSGGCDRSGGGECSTRDQFVIVNPKSEDDVVQAGTEGSP